MTTTTAPAPGPGRGSWARLSLVLIDESRQCFTAHAEDLNALNGLSLHLSDHGAVAEVVTVWGNGALSIDRDGLRVGHARHSDVPTGTSDADRAARVKDVAAHVVAEMLTGLAARHTLTVHRRAGDNFTVTIAGDAGELANLAAAIAQVTDVTQVVSVRDDGARTVHPGA